MARGENSGHTLTHVAVAREFKQVGTLKPGASFAQDVTVNLKSRQIKNERIIVFVQERGSGRVLGSATERLADVDFQSAEATSAHRR